MGGTTMKRQRAVTKYKFWAERYGHTFDLCRRRVTCQFKNCSVKKVNTPLHFVLNSTNHSLYYIDYQNFNKLVIDRNTVFCLPKYQIFEHMWTNSIIYSLYIIEFVNLHLLQQKLYAKSEMLQKLIHTMYKCIQICIC